MKGYKLTKQDYTTHGDTLWGENVTHIATGTGRQLCTADCIHDYDFPVKAALFNRIHANISTPVLWEGEGEELVGDDGLKRGWRKYTTIRIIPLPEISTEKRIEFAIRVAKQVYNGAEWTRWAGSWLSGKDRSAYAADAARAAANAAADAADAATIINRAIEKTFGDTVK